MLFGGLGPLAAHLDPLRHTVCEVPTQLAEPFHRLRLYSRDACKPCKHLLACLLAQSYDGLVLWFPCRHDHVSRTGCITLRLQVGLLLPATMLAQLDTGLWLLDFLFHLSHEHASCTACPASQDCRLDCCYLRPC